VDDPHPVSIAARAERCECELERATTAQRWQAIGEAHGDVQRLAPLLLRTLTVRHARLGILRLPPRTLPLPTVLTKVELELLNPAAHLASSASLRVAFPAIVPVSRT
jgi:hypothetical protein